MVEVLEYYTSGFWVWAGITFGIALIMIPLAERLCK